MKPITRPGNTVKKVCQLAFLLFATLYCQRNNSFSQNTLAVPFNSGFVGDNSGNNAASNCVLMSSLGWTNIYFSQTTASTTFVSQGNDIIGSVVLTDASGVVRTIPGYIKWRAPSGTPVSLEFAPSSTQTLVTTSGTYTVSSAKYIGLIFNGKTLTISGGNVSGNAATTGLLDVLNSYLAAFPSLNTQDYSVYESAGSVVVTVTLSQASGSEIRVNYATSNGTATAGSDYSSTSGQLIFAPNQLSASITISLLSDLVAESSELFYINLSNPLNASIAKSISNITLLDNPPLPIELGMFEAACNDEGTTIEWTTLSEINTDHFIVERSTDNENWNAFSPIEAAGTSSAAIQYSIFDNELHAGTRYYRLNNFDKDGKSKQYGPISVTCSFDGPEFQFHPNPASGNVHIHMKESGSDHAQIYLLTLEGTVVWQQSEALTQNVAELDINTTNFERGSYFIVFEVDERRIIQKLILQ